MNKLKINYTIVALLLVLCFAGIPSVLPSLLKIQAKVKTEVIANSIVKTDSVNCLCVPGTTPPCKLNCPYGECKSSASGDRSCVCCALVNGFCKDHQPIVPRKPK